MGSVQLACVKHAASVRPEPGSNSPYKEGKVCVWLLIILMNKNEIKFNQRNMACYSLFKVHTLFALLVKKENNLLENQSATRILSCLKAFVKSFL